MTRLSYKTLLLIVIFLLIPIVFLLKTKKVNNVAAAWWNDSWSYRQAINISSHTSSESNVYIIATVNIGTTTKSQSDSGDFRFTDQSGNLLNYYISSDAGSTAPTFHIQFTTFPAGAQTIYAYYGNPSASNGFSGSDFSTQASNYVVGSPSSEETGGGPIAWWKFDEGVGTSAFDSSSSQNNGFINNATWTTDNCISGKCLKIGTSSSYVSAPDSLLDTSTSHTYSLWAKANSLPADRTIFGDWTNNDAGDMFYSLTANNMCAYVSGAKRVCTSFSLNTWHHLALTVSGSTMTYYLDGNLIGTASSTVADGTSFSVGRYNTYPSTFDGFVDDIKVYNYARSATQIKQDYASGSTNSNFNSQSSKSLSDGLVGYWKFDEGVGTTSADNSGNNNLATFGTGSSAPSWSSGKFGVGISFNGTTSYLDVGTSITNGTNNIITVTAWIYPTNLAARNTIFSTRKNNPTGAFQLEVGNGNGTARFGISTQSHWDAESPNNAVVANQWQQVVYIKNGTKQQMYINGQPITLATDSPVTFTDNADNKLIGEGALFTNPFNGLIDEVRIYNRALSADEVKQLYNYAPNPIGYWKFDEGVGTTAYDSSGNGNNASLFNGADFDTGKFGKALRLNIGDTTNQYAGINLTHNYSFTKEAWIKPTTFSCQSGRCSIIGPYLETLGPLQYYDYSMTANPGWHSGGSIPLNQWTHVAVSYDQSNVKLYVNGIRVVNTAVGSTNSHNSNYIGALGSNSRNFRGYIDEVKIYNYARTQEQVIQDMQGSTSISPKLAGPIAYYKFDESSGTIANNSGVGGTLNANFASGANSPSWSKFGKSNSSVSFDGNATFASINDNSAIQFGTGDFSFSSWIYPRTVAYGGADQGTIVSKNYTGFELYLYQSKLNAYIGGTNTISGTTTLNTNQWYFVTLTRIGSEVKTYINGVLDGSATNSNSVSNNGANISLGTRTGDVTLTYDGLIDEAKIYNYGLTSDEVKQDYNAGASFVFGGSNETIGATTTNLAFCIPGDTSYCANPVAEWKFEEGVGSTIYDTSGNNNTAIYVPGTRSVGKFGKGIGFTGTNIVNTGNGSSIQFGTGDFTSEAWVKFPTYNGEYYIYGDEPNCGSIPGFSWMYRASVSPHQWYNIFCNGSGTNISNYTNMDGLDDNQWHHVALVAVRSVGVSIYVDGGRYRIGTTQVTSSINIDNANSSALGSYQSAGGSVRNFNGGYMDEAKLYNYARTPAQIAYDYNKGGPIGWWKFDECQGNISYDSSGIGTTGSISIGASGTQTSSGTCTTSGAWANGAIGKINSALSFDGTDDNVSLSTNASSYKITTQMSFSAWFKGSGTIFSNGNNYCGTTGDFYLLSSAFYIKNANCSHLGVTISPNTSIWNHVAVVVNGTLAKVYLNGSLVNSRNDMSYSSLNGAGNTFKIGSHYSNNSYFNGLIDDVRLFSYPLTDTQVKTIYNNGAINFN